jgi:type IV secretory pathway TrbF-like protein
MKKNLRNLFLNDEQYQKELVFFLMQFDKYFQEVKILHPKDDDLIKWETLSQTEQKRWILNVFLPNLDQEYKKEHLNRAYYMLYLSKAGRFFKNYWKENEPEKL